MLKLPRSIDMRNSTCFLGWLAGEVELLQTAAAAVGRSLPLLAALFRYETQQQFHEANRRPLLQQKSKICPCMKCTQQEDEER